MADASGTSHGIAFDIVVDDSTVRKITRNTTMVHSGGRTEADSALARDLLRRGTRVEKRAKEYLSNQRVNVRTGRLRSSVHAELFTPPSGGVGVRIGTDVHYGRYLNDGTRHIRPRLWLTDALDAAR